MTFDDLIAQFSGKGVDWDNFYGFQCFDLAHKYAVDVVGKDIPAAPAAKDLWGKTIDGYEKISNSPTNAPQKGDIVIWGIGLGPYGHVAIFVSGNANSFTSFDQNFPTGSLCHLQNHNYTGVLGWFRPKAIADSHANDLTKMLNWDFVCENGEKYFDPDIDKLDSEGGKKVIATLENLTQKLGDANRSTSEKETELQTARDSLKQALSKVCPDPGAHTGTSSSPTQPSTDTGGDNITNPPSGDIPPTTPLPTEESAAPWLDALIAFFRKLFGGR